MKKFATEFDVTIIATTNARNSVRINSNHKGKILVHKIVISPAIAHPPNVIGSMLRSDRRPVPFDGNVFKNIAPSRFESGIRFTIAIITL